MSETFSRLQTGDKVGRSLCCLKLVWTGATRPARTVSSLLLSPRRDQEGSDGGMAAACLPGPRTDTASPGETFTCVDLTTTTTTTPGSLSDVGSL